MAGSGPGLARQDVRFEPNERPPLPMAAGLGVQYALICLASIVLTPTVMITVAGGSAEYLSWAVFAALVISGITTAIQARSVGRIGAGYVLIMGSTSAFIAVSVTAIEQGGPGMLAVLIIASSLVQFLLASRMALLRRVFTPTVAGTVLILIPVTLTPMILRKLAEVPAGAPTAAGPLVAGVTLAVTVLVPLRFSGALRLWAPALGIVAGSLVAGLGFGIYDMSSVYEARWIGLPDLAYPGLDLSFRPEFWALLPSFLMVTLVSAMDTLGDAIAIQRVSWRRPRAIDSAPSRARSPPTARATSSPVWRGPSPTRPTAWASPSPNSPASPLAPSGCASASSSRRSPSCRNCSPSSSRSPAPSWRPISSSSWR